MRNRPILCLLTSALLLTAACGSSTPALNRAAGNRLLSPPVAKDSDPDSAVVHISLEAAPLTVEFQPGVPTEVWAYNGSFPGPLIEANQGDRIIVDFINNLPEETTIHWHGVRLSNENDGTHLTQEPVPPGGSFTYDFVVPDASLFWYHPHFNSAEQVYRGLYGPLLVHGDDPLPEATERVMVLSDLDLSSGQLVLPWSDGNQQLENAMGYLGNTQLVNGQVSPVLEVPSGGLERWRIVNASGARPFNLKLPGHVLTMVGTDGGLLEAPVEFDSIVISSGERVDLLVGVDGSAGQSVPFLNASYRNMHAPAFVPDPDHELFSLSFKDSVSGVDRNIPAQLNPIQTPAVDAGDHRFQFNAALDPRPADILDGSVPADKDVFFASFAINGMLFPDVVPHQAQLGTVQGWELYNHTLMDHPFHLHGYRFLVESINGEAPPYRGWKDTVNVPGSPGGTVEVKLIVPFEDRAGNWVYHCHVLRHVQLGMMGELEVTP